jgi:RHS repeat-associated protein
VNGNEVTINLTNVSNAQTIVVTMSGVTDGTITNDVLVGMSVLLGDVNGSGDVNAGDVFLVRSQTLHDVTTSNFREDVTCDGNITSGDVSLTQQKTLTSVPITSISQPAPSSGPNIPVQYAYNEDGTEKQLYVSGVTGTNYDFTYQYDALGRFEKISPTGNPVSFQYGYDAASNEAWRLNNVTTVKQTYTFDSLNRMTRRDLAGTTANPAPYEAYGYDVTRPGLLTTIDREDKKRDAFDYFLDGELKSAKYVQASPSGTSLDPLIPSPIDVPDVTGTLSPRTCTYTWDNAGNRTNVTDTAGGGGAYQPNILNQYTTTGNGNNIVGNGPEHEISSYQASNYTYINDTHLSSITKPNSQGGTDRYQLYYDALGRCVVRVLNATTTYYIYDGEKPILEYDSTAHLIAANVYGRGIDEILMRTDYTVTSARALYYQDDHEGSVTHITNASRQVVETYRYDVFGAPAINGNAGNTTSGYNNRFMFTGREYAAKFGIYEYRNRAYHPGLGRFMSEDPKLFDAGDYNLFRYCGNDPVDHTDPMGTDITPDHPEWRLSHEEALSRGIQQIWYRSHPVIGAFAAQHAEPKGQFDVGRPTAVNVTRGEKGASGSDFEMRFTCRDCTEFVGFHVDQQRSIGQMDNGRMKYGGWEADTPQSGVTGMVQTPIKEGGKVVGVQVRDRIGRFNSSASRAGSQIKDHAQQPMHTFSTTGVMIRASGIGTRRDGSQQNLGSHSFGGVWDPQRPPSYFGVSGVFPAELP